MAKNRSSSEIITDILTACASGGLTSTAILSKAALAWYQGKAYIQELVLAGLLESFDDCTYATSAAGFTWLQLERTQTELFHKEEAFLVA